MKSLGKSFLILGALTLLLTANAMALPIAGEEVRMERDGNVPYTMTDLSDDQVYSTFCLESSQTFRLGETYTVESIGDTAIGGGSGYPDGDPVSEDSKWLYAGFMMGAFDSLANAAEMVQNAIWFLEEEDGGSASDWEILNDFIFDASKWTVVAVNLTLNGQDNQSQLVGEFAPVPEPATMLLLGTGFVGLAGYSRRKIKK